MSIIHLSSPLLYILFCNQIKKIEPCPKSKIMIKCRQIHNLLLSLLSSGMFLGLLLGLYQTNKLNSYRVLLCNDFQNNKFAYLSTQIFLYSKYLEWIDTLFLHLSNKLITSLHYNHHMSTAILVYLNITPEISAYSGIPMGLNCLVHIFMYWYFAFPRGVLFSYRRMITISQIVQHIISLTSSMIPYYIDNCNQNKYGLFFANSLYGLYLTQFFLFYVRKYKKT